MTTARKVIGVDLDDVLFGCNSALALFHNARYGTSYERKDVISYDLEIIWNCSREEAFRRIYDFYFSKEHAEAQPVPGSQAAIARLKEHYHLAIITSRPESVRTLTEHWLGVHFPKTFREILFAGQAETKAILCASINPLVFIEDAERQAQDISKLQIPVFLFDTPWNQGVSLENVTRVFSWKEITARLL